MVGGAASAIFLNLVTEVHAYHNHAKARTAVIINNSQDFMPPMSHEPLGQRHGLSEPFRASASPSVKGRIKSYLIKIK